MHNLQPVNTEKNPHLISHPLASSGDLTKEGGWLEKLEDSSLPHSIARTSPNRRQRSHQSALCRCVRVQLLEKIATFGAPVPPPPLINQHHHRVVGNSTRLPDLRHQQRRAIKTTTTNQLLPPTVEHPPHTISIAHPIRYPQTPYPHRRHEHGPAGDTLARLQLPQR